MGEGSEAPFAQALDALAALMLDEPGADDRTGRAITALRAIDAKALLARALTMAATVDFAQGRLDQAEARAREAQRSAEIVGHASERVIALAILARVALMRGDQPAAARHVDTATAQLSGPHAVSRYARQMLSKAAPATP
jgi:ATP/maltotriose-dependent transcriptional regulator MalT